MAAICASSKHLIRIILDKIKGASRLGVCRWFPCTPDLVVWPEGSSNICIVGTIQDVRHLTR